MNVTLNNRGIQCFRVALAQIITRNTSKIAVEIDAEVLPKLESSELKPRQHPGIIKTNIGKLELPANINGALYRIIGDYPIKPLLEDCRRLNRYIISRHPPVETQDRRVKLREIVAEIDKRMPPEQLASLNEEDGAKWRRKRENAINKRLGQETYAWKPISYGRYEAITYAIGRGAQEYGVLMRILLELSERDTNFKPNSFFDFGSGVGTGMWAASNLWKDSIYEYFNVDCSREMHDISELILREGIDNQEMFLRNVFYRQFLPGIDTKYDLVISSYSLFELTSAQNRREVLLNLWRKCDGYLIIIEEGTRRGTELIVEARDFILGLEETNLSGHVFAPCAHDGACPRLAKIVDRTPCNFQLSYPPLKIGDIKADRFTTRYSYVVLKKGAPTDETRDWPRLVRPTMQRSKHVICRMCTADARLQEVIFTKAKHGKMAYKCAKVSRWGDRLPIAVGEPFNKKESKDVDEVTTD